MIRGRCLACRRLMALAAFWTHQETHQLAEFPRRGARSLLWRAVDRQPGDLREITSVPLSWVQ